MAYDPWMVPHPMTAGSLQPLGVMASPQRPVAAPETALDRYRQRALAAAGSRGHHEATLAHLLLGILEAEQGEAAWQGITVDRPALEIAVKRHLQNPSRFKSHAVGATEPRLSDRVGVVIERASAMAQDAGRAAPDLADLFDAMQVYATQTTASAYLRQHGYDRRAMGAAMQPQAASQPVHQARLPLDVPARQPLPQRAMAAPQTAERPEPALLEPVLRAPALSGPHYRPTLGPRYRPSATVQRSTPPMATVGLSAAALDVDFADASGVTAITALATEPEQSQLANGLARHHAPEHDRLAAAFAAGRLQARDSSTRFAQAEPAQSAVVVAAHDQPAGADRAAQTYRLVRKPVAQSVMVASDAVETLNEAAIEPARIAHAEPAETQDPAKKPAGKTVASRTWVSIPAVRSVTHAHRVESRLATVGSRGAQQSTPTRSGEIADRHHIPREIQRELTALRDLLRSYAEHESKHLRALRKIEDVQAEAAFLTKPNAAGHLDNNRQFQSWLEASYQRSNFSVADQRFIELLELLGRIDNRLGDEDAGETGSAPHGTPPQGLASGESNALGALAAGHAHLDRPTGDGLIGVSTALGREGAVGADAAIKGLRHTIRKRRNARIARLMSRFHDYKPRVFMPWDLRRKSKSVLTVQTPRHNRVKPVSVRVLLPRADEGVGEASAMTPIGGKVETPAGDRPALPAAVTMETPAQRFAERPVGAFGYYEGGSIARVGAGGVQSWPDIGRDALTASVQRWQAGSAQRTEPRPQATASAVDTGGLTASTAQRGTTNGVREVRHDVRSDPRAWTMYPLPEWDKTNR